MELIKSASILFILLNPFLMSIYLISLIRNLSTPDFSRVMARAHMISVVCFVIFALAGDSVFENIFKVRFASFLVFGGIIFLLIGIRAVFSGQIVLVETQGSPEHVAGSIAMPFMIAPGTLSASVLIGSRVSKGEAAVAVILAVLVSFLSIMIFKLIHDSVKKRNERVLNRYIEICGRVVALFTGTYAVEMISQGVRTLLT